MYVPVTLLVFSLFGAVAPSRWTEQDEARRIAQLKEQERLEFQMEMQHQENSGGGGFGSDYFSGAAGSYRPSGASQPQSPAYSPYSPQRTFSNPRHYASGPRENFCYFCASPFGVVSPDLQKALQSFLKMRRTKYPSEVVTPQCSNPKDIGALAKQKCLHSYCQTLVLTDHDTGSAFTIRGCAEHFGAIDEDLLEERGDNSCTRLHEALDIQECICRRRRYCYSGPERRGLEDVNAESNEAPTPASAFFYHPKTAETTALKPETTQLATIQVETSQLGTVLSFAPFCLLPARLGYGSYRRALFEIPCRLIFDVFGRRAKPRSPLGASSLSRPSDRLQNRPMLRSDLAEVFDADGEDEESFDLRIRLQFMDARLNAVSEIRDFLFLSGYGCISDAKLRQFGITHAVDCTNLKNKKVEGVEYLHLPMDDNELQNIRQYFDSTADFIQKAAEKGGKVLVYCAAGVSRSATIVMMYLVIKEKMNLREAFTIVNKIRPIIAPNLGFWRQMIEYEQKHNHGKASVELLRGMKRPIPDVYLYKHSMLQQG
ncbi:hypothetical protein QR680_017150 [Steinernema hermaphroditum]|uniref:Tyrosine-protein phosphatase domain-containing protein n=1 Tax=Steinernema hermaphroditum TaxID=289476 RepID=A0AA39HDH2_9BILA|nr:hypothetical protein QR680_017150 [Steinernema hermaphroditum]